MEISFDIEITPMKILSEKIIDADDYFTEKMPRGEGQGGEEDETFCNKALYRYPGISDPA